jgi:hypothetical protein
MYEYEYTNTGSPAPELQTELTKPKHLISLASSGMLVALEVSVWSATKQDKAISNEVTTSKNADKSAGRYTKNLLADHPKHKALLNYRQTMYNWMKRITYSWNSAQFYLPTAELPKFMQEFHDHEAEFNKVLNDFIASYDSIVSDMAFKQGDMFNRNDYPSAEQVRSKCRMHLFVNDVPMNDFRVNIAQDLADDLFNTYSRQTESIINTIIEQQAERFTEVMESISHCCGYDEVGKDEHGEVRTKRRKIYDTTLNKARDMCESFKQFNLSGNDQLEQARAKLERTLAGVTAQDLRESDAVRHIVKKGVDDVLDKFGAFKCIG